ncbi:ribonuclease HI family protein [Vagococcus acidifermentans]|uniref:Ribonuclease HI n=1 Tax=Vagococcus acidifermentans TaxID=564710 RepID=A0A430ALY0_9ENTE|nr:ribonuclease HI family protein [Vagococcus acidifermentans]RSU09095.1 ribonuclease HI [Vagococcus acidifermentans]
MLKIYTDAATNPKQNVSGAGILIVGENLHRQLALVLHTGDNHEAEFMAVAAALRYCIAQDWQEQTIMLHTDSKTVALAIDKNYTGKPAFQPLLAEIEQLLEAFKLVLIRWIPEAKNKGADQLAKQGLQKALKEK